MPNQSKINSPQQWEIWRKNNAVATYEKPNPEKIEGEARYRRQLELGHLSPLEIDQLVAMNSTV